MKNRFKWLKTAQLILLLAATAAGLTLIFTDDRLYQMIGSDPSVRALCALLWLVLGLSYLAVLMDFRTLTAMRRDYRELDYAVYNDRVAGIANRFSCDAMIEKYMDRPVPDTVGCVMLDLAICRAIRPFSPSPTCSTARRWDCASWAATAATSSWRCSRTATMRS